VGLSEDAELVRALITVLYPIPSEIPTSYERVLALLAAAQKYEMSAVQSSIRAEVVRRELSAPAGAQAFRAFAIAFSNKLSPEMGTTARLTLDYPLTFETLGDELRLFQGSALRELAGFRKMCRDNIVSCLESFLDAQKGPSKIWVDCPRSKFQPSNVAQAFPQATSNSRQSRGAQSMFGGLGHPQPSVGVASSVPSVNDNDRRTLPPWLHDLFTQQIGELKKYYTHALIKPSGIREIYLAALVKHSPTSSDCPTCLMVHAQKGEGYCAELEQKLSYARNQVTTAFKSDFFAFNPSLSPNRCWSSLKQDPIHHFGMGGPVVARFCCCNKKINCRDLVPEGPELTKVTICSFKLELLCTNSCSHHFESFRVLFTEHFTIFGIAVYLAIYSSIHEEIFPGRNLRE
jgi:hypothetical protein